MQLHKAVEHNLFPHFLVIFQWALVVVSLGCGLNPSVTITRATANGGLKVIMLFHLFLLLFPIILCLTFFRIRKEGISERCVIGLSVATTLFSCVNVLSHFVDDFVLLTKVTEVVAWSLYSSIFSVSVYTVSKGSLFPVLRRLTNVGEETFGNDRNLEA